ncbi:MAG: FUN14 domain-containing protein [Candidatus Bathyarchaeia archaeon]
MEPPVIPFTALSPVVMQLGIGGIGGYVVGYAAKQIAKIIAVLLGLAFVGLQYLAYKGIIDIRYDRLIQQVKELVGIQSTLSTFLFSNLPFTGGFVAGFALGFKAG